MQKLLQKRKLLPENLVYSGMFDLPRGIFMIATILLHSILVAYPLWEYQNSDKLNVRLVGIAIDLLCRGLIPLLFICCGYSWRKKKMMRAVKGQVSAMLVPYLITAGAVTAMVLVYGLFPGINLWNELRRSSLPFLFGFSPAAPFLGGPINSIGALWCVVVYFFGGILLNWILQEKETWIQLCLALLLVCAGLLLQKRTMVFCFQQTLLCTGYMYLGWLMKKTDFLTREIPTYLILLLVLAGPAMGVFGGYNMSQHYLKNGMADWISGMLMGITLLVLILRCNKYDGKILELVRWMGRANFLICCVHSFWMLIPSAFIGILFLPLINVSASNFALITVYFTFSLLSGVGGAYICQKIKAYFGMRKRYQGIFK